MEECSLLEQWRYQVNEFQSIFKSEKIVEQESGECPKWGAVPDPTLKGETEDSISGGH